MWTHTGTDTAAAKADAQIDANLRRSFEVSLDAPLPYVFRALLDRLRETSERARRA